MPVNRQLFKGNQEDGSFFPKIGSNSNFKVNKKGGLKNMVCMCIKLIPTYTYDYDYDAWSSDSKFY